MSARHISAWHISARHINARHVSTDRKETNFGFVKNLYLSHNSLLLNYPGVKCLNHLSSVKYHLDQQM